MSSAPRYTPSYTVEDYQLWEGDWELWNGVAVAMTPSPFGRHGKLLISIGAALKSAIESARCHATVMAEIDWILSSDTVLRPDLVVVCGPEPERHVEVTPALAVEILAEGTRERDLNFKRDIYQQQSLRYYVIVDPDASQLTVLQLNNEGVYAAMELSKSVTIDICDGCHLSINIESLFR